MFRGKLEGEAMKGMLMTLTGREGIAIMADEIPFFLFYPFGFVN